MTRIVHAWISLTSFVNLSLNQSNLLLLYAWCVWIKAAKLHVFLPGENTIGAIFVLLGRHLILGYGRDICIVFAQTCRSSILYLKWYVRIGALRWQIAA